ncbi:MAG: lipopolysaccharide biosynthesis protein [Anaerolineaceae bacterium]|nr:lipopolysaccharide biosynthesis protein [Anaerolineaceae bacterium]
MNENLGSKTVNSVRWNIISVILTSVFQLIHTAVISRLLEQSAFGLLAMANTVLRFAVYFSRMGVGSAVIQKKELSKDDIQVASTISIILGLCVTLVIYLAAPLSNFLFKSEDVVQVVRVLSLTMVINGFNLVPVSLLRRNFRFRALMISEFVSYFIGSIVVGIPLALFGFGVWSLVISSIVQSLLLSLITYLYVRNPIRPKLSKDLVKPLLSYGGRVSIISFLEYLNYNLDTMMIGRFLGEAVLGLYNRAYTLVSLPAEKITTSMTRVLFSSFSEIQTDYSRVNKVYGFSIEIIAAILIPLTSSIGGSAREITLVILGNNWNEAIPVLRVVPVFITFSLLNSITGVLFEALGWLNEKITITIIRLVILIGVILYTLQFGLTGIVTGICCVVIPYYFFFSWVSSKKLGISFFKLNKNLMPLIIRGILTYFLCYLISHTSVTFGTNNLLTLIIQVIIGAFSLFYNIYLKPPVGFPDFVIKYGLRNEDMRNNRIFDYFIRHYKRLI